jgi:hypothetical protein
MPNTLSHCLPRTLSTRLPLQRSKVLTITFSTKISLTSTTDRSLDRRQDKFCAARASYFQRHKRKISTTKDTHLESKTGTATSKPQSDNMASSKKFKFPGMTSTKPSGNATNTPLIVRFYDADTQAKDSHGRTQEQILSWPDSQLESCHNYIQMLFPVPEGSAFNWEAPIIDRETTETFRARSDLRGRLRQSFERMLNFYGFEVEKQKPREKVNKSEAVEMEEANATVDSEGTDKGQETEAQETTDVATKFENVTSKSTSSSGITSTPDYRIVRADHWRKNFRNWAVRFDHNHLRITRILRCLRILGLQKECDAFFAALKLVYDDPSIKIGERTLSYWTRAVTRPLHIAPDDDEIEWLEKWEKEQEAAEGAKDESKKKVEEAEKGKEVQE